MDEFGAWLAFIVMFVLCTGDPDILDGLIKRANAVGVECHNANTQIQEPPK